ncbi:hypothetical protein [Crenalkalicoccus roseus]|uniref:hypothetical protein n=1 Tax=Crenalkalicoccus roseus TaxID=1485588 RepID=UPI0038D1D011
MDLNLEQAAVGVGQDGPLAPRDLLAGAVASSVVLKTNTPMNNASRRAGIPFSNTL